MPFVKGCHWTEKQREICGFPKGVVPWNKGKSNVYSEETLRNWGVRRKGKVSYFKGVKHTQEAIEKLREAAKFHPNRKGPKGKPWSLARKLAQEARAGKPYKKPSFYRRKKINTLIRKGNNVYPANWIMLRKQIYKRDGWICQECGAHCHNTTKQKIQCHHIDYNSTNNVLDNLITLCASCHAKTNFKRNQWQEHYKNILRSRWVMPSEN